MCTVTIIAARQSRDEETLVRLVCNRDEQRKRPPALPPVIRQCGVRAAVMPVDPVSDGTWVAVNDAGLMATLLNVNVANRESRWHGAQSRGTIIPQIMHCENVGQAVEEAGKIDVHDMAEFRLVLCDARHIAELRSDGTGVTRRVSSFGGQPVFFTSSGLGDELAQKPRRQLFEESFHKPGNLIEKQDWFHAHFWRDRTHLSVLMSRPDACTVSRTVIELNHRSIRMTYTDTAAIPPKVFPIVHLHRRVATP